MTRNNARNKTVLGIETATEICSAGLYTPEFQDEISHTGKFAHSEKLINLIDEILKKNSLSLRDISAIGVSIGPGSFTGLRIGLSVAKGIAEVQGIPLIPVSSMESLIHSSNCKKPVITTLIHSHKELVYHQRWKKEGSDYGNITDIRLLDINEVFSCEADNSILLGAYSEKLVAYPVRLQSLSGRVIGELAYRRRGSFQDLDFSGLEPAYYSEFKAVKWKEYEQSRKRLADLRGKQD